MSLAMRPNELNTEIKRLQGAMPSSLFYVKTVDADVSNLNEIRVCFQSHQQAKLCKPEQCSRQMNESEESASELFEAHSDSAMIFDLHEKAFNKMPFFVVIEIGVPWIN